MNRTALSLVIIGLVAAVGCQQQHEPYFEPKLIGSHLEKGIGLVVDYDCAGHMSTQAKAEAWIRTEIPVGTTRAKAIDALKKRAFSMSVLLEPNRFYMIKITRPCDDRFGRPLYLTIVVDLDASARVTETKAYLVNADESFGQGSRPFSTMIGNTR